MTSRVSLPLAGASAGLLLVLVLAAGAGLDRGEAGIGALPVIGRAAVPARNSPCNRRPSTRLTYHYPVKPFRRQHPIRGFFGDPRTVTAVTFGEDKPGSPGSFTFHNGIDISASTGTAVYPVVTGIVRVASGDRVIVDTADFRTFQYYHLTPAVRPGQHVIAYRTVLGTVKATWEHVHLTEIDGFRVHNPLDPGHLEPYGDHTVPNVEELVFRSANGVDLDPRRLHGRITIAADARDMPPIPVPGIWLDFPVTPALVSWRMVSHGSTVVGETIVADFRYTEPPAREFWRVYAAGTYQNFPVFDHSYYFHYPGKYLFSLTPTALDTTQLANGTYGVTVDAADVCGNVGSLSELVTIHN